MIINIYSVTQDGSLKINQVFFLDDAKPTDKINYRHVFTSNLAKNSYKLIIGDLPEEEK